MRTYERIGILKRKEIQELKLEMNKPISEEKNLKYLKETMWKKVDMKILLSSWYQALNLNQSLDSFAVVFCFLA